MDVCRLLGREENGMATQLDAHLLRLLTPVAKLYTGKQVHGSYKCDKLSSCCFDADPYRLCFVLCQAVAVVSEGLESFGGQGYIEDTGLPGLLRDAQVRSIHKNQQYFTVFAILNLTCLFLSQVLSIWEGTTNVLSLDVLRSVARSSGMVLHAYFTHAKVRGQGMSPSDKFSNSSMTEFNRNVMCTCFLLLVVPACRCIKCFFIGPGGESSRWCSL